MLIKLETKMNFKNVEIFVLTKLAKKFKVQKFVETSLTTLLFLVYSYLFIIWV